MSTEQKAWGTTRKLLDRNGIEVHRIVGRAGGYCSKHLHEWKFNRFYVERGTLMVVLYSDASHKETEHVLRAGDEMTVHPGTLHRFRVLEENTVALEFYWTEGCPVDIQRLDVGGVCPDPDHCFTDVAELAE